MCPMSCLSEVSAIFFSLGPPPKNATDSAWLCRRECMNLKRLSSCFSYQKAIAEQWNNCWQREEEVCLDLAVEAGVVYHKKFEHHPAAHNIAVQHRHAPPSDQSVQLEGEPGDVDQRSNSFAPYGREIVGQLLQLLSDPLVGVRDALIQAPNGVETVVFAQARTGKVGDVFVPYDAHVILQIYHTLLDKCGGQVLQHIQNRKLCERVEVLSDHGAIQGAHNARIAFVAHGS